MRPIDADAFLKALDLYINRSSLGEITISTELSIGEICSLIKDQPTIDAEPVKHGHWILEREPDGTPYCLHCSLCDPDFRHIGTKTAYEYCPNCGAKMDEE